MTGGIRLVWGRRIAAARRGPDVREREAEQERQRLLLRQPDAARRRQPLPRWRHRPEPRSHRVRSGSGGSWGKVASAVTSLTAIAALLFTALSLQQTRTQNQLATAGQITDRFNAAVTNLGSDTEAIRIGGIYALQRIMQDSSRDQPAILQVLTAFVREHAPLASATPTPARSAQAPGTDAQAPHLAIDVQTALTVLGTRDPTHDQGATVDLHQTDLENASLSHASLNNANLFGANLNNANLDHASLNNANLFGASLEANLQDASLHGASLDAADLNHATLNGADLTGASLFNARLSSAGLFYANLSHADLISADLSDALLDDANLSHADLGGTNFNDANLLGASLDGTDLSHASLHGTNLFGAHTDSGPLCSPDRKATRPGNYVCDPFPGPRALEPTPQGGR
jgi:uncharacterized protein YjbI with pentapeptide repeats